VFSLHERAELRDALLSAARRDARITGAALTGSGALGGEDRWSDIDLAFGVGDGVDLAAVVSEWTDAMYGRHGAVHHLDVTAGATLYRVFLLASTLQVDLVFSPASHFGAVAATFRLVFGVAEDLPAAVSPSAGELIGLGWLYALHARSSIARERLWQAEYMISGLRDHVFALACLRHGLSPNQGRGMDSLPAELLAGLSEVLVGSLEAAQLQRAFRAAAEALIVEAAHVDGGLARRLAEPLRELASGPGAA
jgi:hypothetical protein